MTSSRKYLHQVEDEELRGQILDLLRVACTAPDSRLRVIITLRADFYDSPLLYEEFGILIQSQTQVVLPLNTEEIHQAIVGPAEQAGLQVDPELVSTIIAEVQDETGSLPLLQYALTEDFARREGHQLTLQAYRESGGVLGALARRAEEVFAGISDLQKASPRQIFMRLVTLGEGTEDTRRRVRRSELVSIVPDQITLQTMMDAFGKFRLLTFDRDPETREPTVEVAHEALIQQWTRLRNWLDESRNDIRQQRLLAAAASDWLDADQDTSYLLAGVRLAQFREWVASSNFAQSSEEQAYLDASISEQQRLDQLESERQAHERMMEHRLRQRLQWIVGILVFASIIGIMLTIAALIQREDAQHERDIARREAKISGSLAKLGETFRQNSEGQTVDAIETALVAASIDDAPQEVYDFLYKMAYDPGLVHEFTPHTTLDEGVQLAPVKALAISPGGSLIASGTGQAHQ